MEENPKLRTATGTIVRIVDDAFAYVFVDDDRRSYSFGGAAFARHGVLPSLKAHQIVEGTNVQVALNDELGIVEKLSLPESGTNGAYRSPLDGVPFEPPTPPADQGKAQLELHPEREIAGTSETGRALPPKTRAFGKIVDVAKLLPGDLLLSRDLEPDRVSSAITKVQERGGYGVHNARWTHAAMYVGDGQHVVEATFDSVPEGGSVRLTSLDEYCTGEYCLRFRRPRALASDSDRWRLCVRAMSRLHQDYHFREAVRMWFRVMVSKKGFYNDKRRGPLSDAAICSTLYADAYNEATRRSLGEIGGVCVPAWLSGSDEFVDVDCQWIGLR